MLQLKLQVIATEYFLTANTVTRNTITTFLLQINT